MPESFFAGPTPFLKSACQILFEQGNHEALKILAEGEVKLAKYKEVFEEKHDQAYWQCPTHVFCYRLEIALSVAIFQRVSQFQRCIETQIFSVISDALIGYESESDEVEDRFGYVIIKIKHGDGENWQKEARARLARSGTNNQGRVRSDNIASIVHHGLLFRSIAEVNLFDALKRARLLLAPLPVFVKSSEGSRVEPDFFIINEGVMLIVEIDGSTYHTETPIVAQERLEEFTDAGVQHIRIAASACMSSSDADKVARKIRARLEKIRKLH